MTLFTDIGGAATILRTSRKTFARKYVATGRIKAHEFLASGSRPKIRFMTADVERVREERLKEEGSHAVA